LPTTDAPGYGSDDRMDTTEDTQAPPPTHAADLPHRPVLASGLPPHSSVPRDLPPIPVPATSAAGLDAQMQETPLTAESHTEPASTSLLGAGVDAQEAPSSGKIRGREEEEYDDEDAPSIKRTKTEVDTSSRAEFKVPDLPASPSAPARNGVSTSSVSYSTSPITKSQQKWLIDKLKNVRKVKAALPFQHPVDPVALNIPSYPTIVTRPMDLSTIESKLKNEQYASIDEYVGDFNLMIQNSITFNGPDHAVSALGQSLKAYFDKQMSSLPSDASAQPAKAKKEKKPPVAAQRPAASRRESRVSVGGARSPSGNETFALGPNGMPTIRRDSTIDRPKREIHRPPPRDLPYSTAKPKRKKYQLELKFCDYVATEMTKPKYSKFSYPFVVPVDPVALNIPNYHNIIKKPMDMQTVTQKLKNGQYENAKEFESDVRQIFFNCEKFNPRGDFVWLMGQEYKKLFEDLWAGKSDWMAQHAPPSQPQSPASTPEYEEEEEDEVEDQEPNVKAIQEQIAALSAQIGDLARNKTKSGNKKGGKLAGTGAKYTKSRSNLPSASSRAPPRAKPKPNRRALSWDEKIEISVAASEKMSQEQTMHVLEIIQSQIPKYENVNAADLELDIDELPNEVLHIILKYVRQCFPPARGPSEPAVDDDYEPERRAPKSSSMKPKKHKPMGKHEQELRIQDLKRKLGSQRNAGSASDASPEPAKNEEQVSSGDDDESESSEEE
ncbi:hypothetical protein B0A49_10829, partial [Cryomyces minteri]